jgi:hypothetical protein
MYYRKNCTMIALTAPSGHNIELFKGKAVLIPTIPQLQNIFSITLFDC